MFRERGSQGFQRGFVRLKQGYHGVGGLQGFIEDYRGFEEVYKNLEVVKRV